MGAVSTSKRSGAGKSVLVFFIVFIILEMLIVFGVGKVFKNEEVTPSVMGYSLFLTKEDLLTNGDEGAQVAVPKNVLVIASEGSINNNPEDKIGHAVLCENVDGVGTGVFWLANAEKSDDSTHLTYTVANGNKTFEVAFSDLIGECTSYFKTAGTVISFMTTKLGMLCCAVVPLFLLVLIELIIAIATHTNDDDDDEDEDDEEEEKEVELDDFLFGGKSEGEQIARKRKKARIIEEDEDDDEDFAPVRKRRKAEPVEEDEDEEEVLAPARKKRQPADDFEELAPRRERAEKPAPKAEKPAAAEQSAPEEAPAAKGSLSLREDEKMSEYYEKASKMVDGENAANGAAPANRRPKRRPPQRRRPASSGMSGDASLEDLMKLMEEEQNKLKKSMK